MFSPPTRKIRNRPFSRFSSNLHIEATETLTSYNNIFKSPRNGTIPISIKHRLIPRVQPQQTLLIPSHDLPRLLLIHPIPLLQTIPCNTQLAPLPNLQNLSISPHYF